MTVSFLLIWSLYQSDHQSNDWIDEKLTVTNHHWFYRFMLSRLKYSHSITEITNNIDMYWLLYMYQKWTKVIRQIRFFLLFFGLFWNSFNLWSSLGKKISVKKNIFRKVFKSIDMRYEMKNELVMWHIEWKLFSIYFIYIYHIYIHRYTIYIHIYIYIYLLSQKWST